MIKLIISDLDGTLLNKDNKVLQGDRLAIQRALLTGIDFCLASGRKDYDIQAVEQMLGATFHRISQNGAFVFSKNNEPLHQSFFHPPVAHEIYKQTKQEDVITIISTMDKEYVEEKNKDVLKIEKRLFSSIEIERDLARKIGTSIPVSKIIINGEGKKLQQLQEQLTKTYAHDIDTYISDPHILDVMPKNINKGNAIRVLLQHLGIKEHQIACIGDSFNDIPMFNLTKHSFAMASAPSEVQSVANDVVQTVEEAVKKIMTDQV